MTAAAPYPGLRPFEADEVDVFFGREEQIDSLLLRLDRGRFLAVVGPSGCGKSSLVHAGLVPALETGFLASAGASWRVAEMRPGDRPLFRLAEALLSPAALGPERAEQPGALGFLLATLRRGPLGLVEVLEDTPPPEGTQLLLVVDQFEEIFRYHRYGDADEAEAFVALLLATIERAGTPVYVVLTMRSDFLGDCAAFTGLPEALNDSQFLTPRMRREERQAAIEGPAGVFGARIEPVLVNRLLNDMGDDPDQLPRMQHLLMRLWNRASSETDAVVLTAEEYHAIGGFDEALSRHADEAYAELDPEGRRIAEHLFRALSERGDDLRDTRRPAQLGEVAEVAGVSPGRVAEVVEVFRRPDRSFLTPPVGVELEPETVVDVSHESLIRQWRRLRRWVEEEAESAALYRRLAETARLWKAGQAGLWGPPDLDIATSWRERERPTEAWARRYGGDFETAMEFLTASEAKRIEDAETAERAREERERGRRAGQRNRLLTAGLALAALLLFLAFSQWRRADEQRDLAERHTRLAQAEELLAHAHENLTLHPQRSLLLAVEAMALEREATGDPVHALQVLQEALTVSGGEPLTSGGSPVSAFALAPDGRWLAAGHADGRVELVETGAGAGAARGTPRDLARHEGEVSALAFSPDGRFLASAGVDGTLRVFDLPGAEPRLLGHGRGAITSLAVTPDGRRLVSGEADGTVLLWASAGGDGPVAPGVHHTHPVTSLAFSPDGTLLASAAEDGTVLLRQHDDGSGSNSGDVVLEGHRGAVDVLAFTPDGRWLATGGRDNLARLWRVGDGGPDLILCGHDSSVSNLAVTPEGDRLITGSSDGTARVWSLSALTAGARRRAPGDGGRVLVAAGDRESCGPEAGPGEGPGAIWDLDGAEEELSVRLAGHGDDVTALAVSPPQPGTDVRLLATASRDRSIRVWSLGGSAGASGHASLVLHGHDAAVEAAAFHPRELALFTGSADGSARSWDLSVDADNVSTYVLSGPHDAVLAVASSASGRWLAAGSEDNATYLWDFTALAPPMPLRGHTSSVIRVVMGPADRWMATTSTDRTVRLWGLAGLPGKLESRTIEGYGEAVDHLAFDPAGEWLATASRDGGVLLSELATGSQIALCSDTGSVGDLAVSGDGRWLALARPETVELWDLPALAAGFPPAGGTVRSGDSPYCRLHFPEHRPAGLPAGPRREIAGSGARVTALAFVEPPETGATPRLALGDEAGGLRLLPPGDGATARPDAATVSADVGSPVTALAAGPRGRWLAVGAGDGTGRLYPLAPDGSVGTAIRLEGHMSPVSTVGFGPRGRWLVSGSHERSVRLWDLEHTDPAGHPGVLSGHTAPVTSLAFGPEGRYLATGSRDQTVRSWALELWALTPGELVELACRVAGRELTRAEWETYLPDRPYDPACTGGGPATHTARGSRSGGP